MDNTTRFFHLSLQTLTFFITALFITALQLICTTSYASESDSKLPSVYQSTKHPMINVDKGLELAKANNKKLLLVMGAQWCHDSRGLAENFSAPEMLLILNQHYQVVFIDVGYFNDLRQISQRFGQAHYFATPTVMIIDPQSERLLNAQTMHIWGGADSIAFDEYKSYFTKYTSTQDDTFSQLSVEHKRTIENFKTKQANRLMQAYQILIPDMVKQDETGKYTDEFITRWNEVKQFRMSLQRDIVNLYEAANGHAQMSLAIPQYDSFSWESVD